MIDDCKEYAKRIAERLKKWWNVRPVIADIECAECVLSSITIEKNEIRINQSKIFCEEKCEKEKTTWKENDYTCPFKEDPTRVLFDVALIDLVFSNVEPFKDIEREYTKAPRMG